MTVPVPVWKNVEFEFVLFFLLENSFWPYFEGDKKDLENWENNIENVALSVHVLLEVIYNHCLTMTVAVLSYK